MEGLRRLNFLLKGEEKIKQAGIHLLYITRPEVAKYVINAGKGLRIKTPLIAVYGLQIFTRVGVIKAEAPFA